MKIILNVQRYNPRSDAQPHFQDYAVEADPNERLLDALMHVKRFQDGSLAFRKSCAHGVCGSDAMRINGKDGLACKTLIKEVAKEDGDTITVEPLALSAGSARSDRRSDRFFQKIPGRQTVSDQRRTRGGKGAHSVPGGTPAFRRHHQLHPVRVLLFGLSGPCKTAGVSRTGRHLPGLSVSWPTPGTAGFEERLPALDTSRRGVGLRESFRMHPAAARGRS